MSTALFPGTVLKERRELLGHTLGSVSREIHVPIEYIEAFEAGRIDKTPGRAYAIGFLRSYCRFLDLDPDPFCDQYLLCTRPPKGSHPFKLTRRGDESGPVDGSYPRWVNELINWGTVCLIILISWLAYTVVIQPVAESWKSRVEAGAVEIEAPVHFNEEL